MPTVTIHAPDPRRENTDKGSMPELLNTPLGYALLELQGTINFPESSEDIKLGRITFPNYDPATGATEGPWMKKVYLFIGHQRMTGEVQKLKTALGLLKKCGPSESTLTASKQGQGRDANDFPETEDIHSKGQDEKKEGDLEIVEIIYYKLVFRSRPEPVGLAGD